MRLAAIYIPPRILNHIFGKDHNGYTLNLGGKYLYDFEQVGDTITLKSKQDNPSFIENFWGEDIELVSAIVGANGTGKSTLLNIFRKRTFCQYIFEDLVSNEYKIIENTENTIDIVYYTPYLNIEDQKFVFSNFKDISKYELMLEDTEYESIELSAQLELHNSENLKRWIKFRQIQDIETLLNDISLPLFNKINVKIRCLNPAYHQTPYAFRPFFDRFKTLREEEAKKKFEDLRARTPDHKEKLRSFGNNIKLELEIIERIIDKLRNILESSGNEYLKEGYINGGKTIDSDEFKDLNNLKDAFYWFLENAFIQISKDSEKIFFPIEKIKNLVEVLLKNVPVDYTDIENWTELNVSLDEAFDVLQAYEEFIISFKDNFSFDRKILLSFRPDKNISSGEKGMYDLFSSLYDYKFKVDNNILEEYNSYSKRERHNENYLILLDEADSGFHPSWKRKYVNAILTVFQFLFSKPKSPKNLQILFTTHDPLTLSDIPQNNIVYLGKDSDDITFISKNNFQSFGANIHDLLAHSFFLEDGLMGEFANYKIDKTIKWINENQNLKEKEKDFKINYLEYEVHKKIIDLIDEPVLQTKLNEMLSNLNTDNKKIENIEKQIRQLQEEKEKLKKGRDDIS